MLLKKISLLFLLTTYATSSYALFCPNNFNEINIGDSIEKVTQQCGKPSSEKSYESKINEPQEWNYYVQMVPGQQGSIKMTIAFANNKVINMSVNGVGLTQTEICGGTIQLGDTQDQIKTACGKPVFVNKVDAYPGAPKPAKMTEFRYLGTPTVTLTFENGKLKERF